MRQVFQACLLLACLRYGEAILKEVDFQMENHFVFFLEMDYGLDVGATITVDLVNRKPANDTYVMILSHGQWLAWRETELVTLKSDPEQPESRSPLNAYLVSCWRGLLTDKLQGTFQVEEQTGGRNRYTVILVSALKSPVEVKGSLSLVNPGGQELSLQDRDVPKALMCLGILFIVSTLALLPLVVRKGALQALLVVVLALRGVVLMRGPRSREAVGQNRFGIPFWLGLVNSPPILVGIF
ncbi:unnamed protein product [Effrenium voratum]|nr:unnamed protein product [Effrenium voratum]